jgi:hypothetical protein
VAMDSGLAASRRPEMTPRIGGSAHADLIIKQPDADVRHRPACILFFSCQHVF